jgi:CRP-like cAMP-binding protein
MPIKSEVLRKIPFFSIFKNEAELQAFVQAGNWAKHSSGDMIYRIGEPARKIYVIVSGKVRIIRHQKNLATLGLGEVFGEIGPLLELERTVNAVAAGDTILFEFDKGVLDRASLETRCELIQHLYIVTTRRFVETTRRISAI